MYCWMLSFVREILCLFSQEGLGSVLRRPFGLSRDKVYLNRSTQGRYRNCGARGMGRLKMPLIYRIQSELARRWALGLLAAQKDKISGADRLAERSYW